MNCAECGTRFTSKQTKACFCSRDCRQAFHNRAAARGKTLTPMIMASRQGRGTEVGKLAQAEWARLAARFAEEDKAAGRMSMLQFVKRQHALGLLGATR